jgi:hypothetical protein
MLPRMPARSSAPRHVRVCIEATAKRAFASALDWPGWCRSGRDERAALDALLDYTKRYAVVARAGSVPFATGELTVIERLPGSATTDFGAPATPAKAESEPLGAVEVERLTALVGAAWRVFDGVVAAAPSSLRKGPRGGGRDRDAMAEHVLAAEHAYARKLSVRLKQPRLGDAAAISAFRDAVIGALRSGDSSQALVDRGWLPRYAARRIAWHVLDHTWEMEDRTER